MTAERQDERVPLHTRNTLARATGTQRVSRRRVRDGIMFGKTDPLQNDVFNIRSKSTATPDGGGYGAAQLRFIL